ncbi:RING/U-box superfamily protein [Raphanus sativus]|uniref:RBR-type E3 ubiquitin transferase n=1 Tax=Raphanus sativus TaxID=3726 RepID=A0A6J0PA08_RAPSA|nr:E3 ubiquitin-protein ligase RSL1-like [Raphanus sativus]XP_056863834.1 E3 ubiquitin-protein ligase RSL1-like [Raphanus sativus]KAJ4915054.1 RING/U-box superfamily protein [Raphanus sativus]
MDDNELELARQKLDLVSLGESSSTYRLYSKGLVSEEVVKDDTMLVGGSGLSLCDSNDNSKFETKKALRNNRVLAHPEAAELAAIIQGLSWALELGVKSIQFFCDDPIILDYVTRKSAPNESIVETLLEKVAHLEKKFTSCQALAVERRDINSSVIKLARDAIASQTRWRDDTNTEYETCPACYAHVSPPSHKLEVSSGCFHRICFTCIRDCVSSQLERGDTVLCPYPGCEKELVLEDCRGIVDDDALNLIIHRKKEKAIPVLDRVYCPKPSCNFLMSDRDLPLGISIDPRQKSVARTCVECGLCFCKKCHVPWHYKKTCDEFKKSPSYLTSDAALLESLVKTEGWMKCPQCATVVQKNGGCQRISCRHCNHKFCYACGAACTRKKMSCNCSPQD